MRSINFLYEVGTIFNDSKRNMVITERKVCFRKRYDKRYNKYYTLNDKWYKYTCNTCGWNDGLIVESELKRGGGCACCASRVVVQGINDIPTTSPWMVKYFQGGEEEAKLYTSSSNKKIYPKCPDCEAISDKPISINNINKNKGFGCVCKDGVSYPNKFSYYVFKQINDQYQIYQREFCPDWSGLYSYDNYFILLDGTQIIVEMDGLLGHGLKEWKSSGIDIEGKNRDLIKDELAKAHDIVTIRINSVNSDKNFLRENLCKYLGKYFNFSNVDWDYADTMSHKNLVKMVCQYYEAHKFSQLNDIGVIFGIRACTVLKYLKIGKRYGWCTHKSKSEIKKENIIKFKELKSLGMSNNKIKEILGVHKDTINNYIKEINKKYEESS